MVSLTTMYPAQANSPTALLASGITDSATSITVDNGNVLPAATNWLTIGADTDDAETVLMTEKSGNVLTVTRGQQGTAAKAWAAGAKVQRCFTASDHDVLISNVGALNSGKAESSHKSTHATDGGDALSPADIGAQAAITASGILKGNGSAVSAATAGTDYVAPSALSDYLAKSGGTMTGGLTASNPAVADAKVRNISAGTDDLTAGTSELATGALYFVYE